MQTLNVTREVAALQRLGVKALRERYAEVFGEATPARNKVWLVKRIAWRLQALAEGDLSERARRRAAELANDADLRLNPPRDKPAPVPLEPTGVGTPLGSGGGGGGGGWLRGGLRRRSASRASSAARWRARWDRSPSARACSRQAMRLVSQVL